MCTDFTSINKACLKDCYPFPNIDRLVDSSNSSPNQVYLEGWGSKLTLEKDFEWNPDCEKSFQKLKNYL
ncbi:hypothetical protein LIER_42098 [Lithospermum erythrorhizon]|uniref:Uncharacterized protein n=1 Tax=Lithospermum erythrorhizon TaxID=34254 RepID=A0AAV3RPP9_LITER